MIRWPWLPLVIVFLEDVVTTPELPHVAGGAAIVVGFLATGQVLEGWLWHRNLRRHRGAPR